ncbi:class I SAM-dependent methyltransferase [Thalassomonas sp. M1454]|uniref:class I SAM-dependent methyltransferase n=1 Tax=Thalassomonas sp. M1454 TaxID=2594477 RepID=UPI00117D5BD3|nr:class I SAM-dependent methyltransferase [Thalassomonas sp. M1454]
MKPALAFNKPQEPLHWQDMPNGELIAQHIEDNLNLWWPRIFGYHLLKLGSLSAAIDCSLAMIKHQVMVNDRKGFADVIADIDDLPFTQHSVDACLLSHSLEFAIDPHHVLREADRVLIPNGHMVITGFNPISFAGLNKIIPFRRQETPWHGRFFTPMRVKDWLNLLGYEILEDKRILHRSLHSPIKSNGWLSNQWQRFANNYLSSFGSVYIIVAKKRVHPLTPIRPKWKLRPNFKPVNVSSMQGNNHSSSIKKTT